jgi:hypothetical protein
MQKRLFYVIVFHVFVAFSCKEKSFTIDKNETGSVAIVIPDSANSISLFASSELKKHLDLVFKGDIPVIKASSGQKFKKQLFVGIRPGEFKRNMKPEEAIYAIGYKTIYFFGDDAINVKFTEEKPGDLKDKTLSEVLNLSYNRTGTLFAVYSFLENELGVRWIKPGDQGLFYPEIQSISLPQKEVSWTPALIQRNIRTDLFSFREQTMYGKFAPQEFQLTEADAIKKQIDVLIWMRRMKMGRSANFKFGHAFTSYWEKYRDSDPEIFALNGKGRRKPVGHTERVKMCPTNAELSKIIVKEWRESFLKNPLQNGTSISGCENDSDGYGNDEWCHCDSCMAIDERKAGEQLTDYVTDRYVHLWNKVLREARQYKNDIMVTGYAYENMLKPPRREKIDDGIMIEFIPRMGGDFDVTRKLYEGWRNAGMKMMMYRPNDMNWEIGIPFGQEERLFNNYKLAIENGASGTDFDSMLGFWDGISDMAYYILSRGNADPKASFGSLENEFLSSFGEAHDDIAKYYRHWRDIFNNKVLREELRLNDGINTHFLEWARLYRLTERIDEFYSVDDFNITDSFLRDALTRNISEQARNYIGRMQISNLHSRLTFLGFIAGKSGKKEQITENARNLVNFRIQNKDKVDINWNVLFQYQHYQMHDQIGTKYLGFLPKDINSDEF